MCTYNSGAVGVRWTQIIAGSTLNNISVGQPILLLAFVYKCMYPYIPHIHYTLPDAISGSATVSDKFNKELLMPPRLNQLLS